MIIMIVVVVVVVVVVCSHSKIKFESGLYMLASYFA